MARTIVFSSSKPSSCSRVNEAKGVAKDETDLNFLMTGIEVPENLKILSWIYTIDAMSLRTYFLLSSLHLPVHPTLVTSAYFQTRSVIKMLAYSRLERPRPTSARLSLVHNYEYRRYSKYWSPFHLGGWKKRKRRNDYICFERIALIESCPTGWRWALLYKWCWCNLIYLHSTHTIICHDRQSIPSPRHDLSNSPQAGDLFVLFSEIVRNVLSPDSGLMEEACLRLSYVQSNISRRFISN